MGSGIGVTRLENGLRVVTASMPGAASTALGIWVEAGSRDEQAAKTGISHFLEHLLFKGTPTRSARRVVEEIEGVGGSINAFTEREYTCYHTHTLHEHAEGAFDVLSDIFLNPKLDDHDIELEREVIVQEILDAEDNPEDYVHDYHLLNYWPGHALGRPVTGTVDTVAAITREDLAAFIRRRYRADRVIVTAAGRVDHERLVELCRNSMSRLEPVFEEPVLEAPHARPGTYVCRRDLEQVQMVLGMPGLAAADPRRHANAVLLAALGGGMSSRLFQTVREEYGKAYSIYTFGSAYRDSGMTGICAGTGADAVATVVDLVLDELRDLAHNGLEPDELTRTKGYVNGGLKLGCESPAGCMEWIGHDTIYFGRPVSIAEQAAAVEAVTNREVVSLARELFDEKQIGLALLGDVEETVVSAPAA